MMTVAGRSLWNAVRRRAVGRGGFRRLAGLAAALGVVSAVIAADEANPPPSANPDSSCLECHDDAALTMRRAGRTVSLFVDPQVTARSAHASLACLDCHEGFDGDASPHKANLTPVDCASCHEDTAKKHRFHPRLALTPAPAGQDTDCKACHGTHAITPVKAAAFAFRGAGQAKACGECHEQAAAQFAASAHGRALRTKEPNAPDCLSCHRQPIVSPRGIAPTLEQKLAQTKLCESCHVDQENVARQALRGKMFVRSFAESVHGAALHAGNPKAANCVDCHGAHEMNRAVASTARLHQLHVASTCAKCHEKSAVDYEASVHAAALRKGNLDSPACTSCHGEHDIRKHTDPTSPVHKANVAQQVCADCHASLRFTKKYGLSSKTFQTFSDSYHGLAVRGGAVEVVNCASCHSSHAIKSQHDPTSTVNKANLAQTCGQCHPGANTRFAVGAVHVSPETAPKDGGEKILYLVSSLYLILIVVVVGGMGVHNALDFLKKARRKLWLQKGLIAEEVVPHRLHLRLTVHERLQHAGLVISFTLLVITGFMLRYPEAWWVVGLRRLSAHAFEWRGLIHRIAGVVLVGGTCWHAGYLAFTARGRALFRDLLPRWNDVTDPWKVLKYNLGLAPEKPKFGRFSYIEKVEYWALVWGTFVMAVTGAILWFENTSIGLVTKLGFDISRTVHFYEAVLATLAIIVWHFYFVIFNPDVYPMNLAWLTGHMSEKEMLDEHPLELERLRAQRRDAAGEDDTPPVI